MANRFALLLALTAIVFGTSSANDLKDVTIISRSEWGAKAPKQPPAPLKDSPAPYVIIHHSETAECATRALCQARVRSIQNYHINEKHWDDIGYNFLVGEDGNVYEGRGWNVTGAHAPKYNDKSVGICILGTYQVKTPNEAALQATKNLISYGLAKQQISSKYTLLGHRQVRATDCPGNKLYELIKTWPHWSQKP